jgi:uncharacterized protein (TIGR02757 family)
MKLKDKLEYHYRSFDRSKIEPDPLQFLHMFSDPKDIEAIGFLASVFAYGNVTQIINTLNKVVRITGNSPYQFLLHFNIKKDFKKGFDNLKHRFYTPTDIIRLFELLKDAYQNFSSLNNLFLFSFNNDEINVKNGITGFSNFFIESYRAKFGKPSRGITFMFPIPEKGSACKRMNLFLRWMVRKDELDFGIWNGILTSQLIIPVDTHIASICKRLRLTTRNNVSWQMAEEITNNLKKYDLTDPVKYDFALCHIGMRKLKL